MSEVSPWVRVAIVTRPHGVKGALRLHLENPDSDLFSQGLRVRLSHAGKTQPMTIARVFARGEKIELEEISTREDADALRGAVLEVNRDDFPETDDDETYLVDLIGAEVKLQSGEHVGVVAGISDNGAQPLLQIQTVAAFGTNLVDYPFVAALIASIDEDAGVIVIDPPAGLIIGDGDPDPDPDPDPDVAAGSPGTGSLGKGKP